MEFSIKSGNPEKQRSACVVVGVFEPRKLTLAAELIDNAARSHLSDIIRRGDMEGKAGTTLLLHNVPGTLCDRVLLVGLGKEKEFGDREYCDAIRSAVRTLNETGSFDGTVFLTETSVRKRSAAWRVRQAALVAQQTVYRFDQFKSKKDKVRRPLRKLTFIVDRRNELAVAEEALCEGQAIAEGMSLAKDLANLPGNVCTPSFLAETAQKLAEEHLMECQILEREEMAALGMHALLSVAQSSHQAPKLIVLQYKGGKSDEKPVVLVGKGVTFDSGGISLKPAPEMDEMKYDMCGAASVLGTIKAAALMKLPLNLTVIVPSTENMPGGGASRPGDIVTSMSGQTIEILNTDAEGRLILCDALTYAARFEPDTVIDVATLTGACVVALGHVATGLFANNDTLARELENAGDEAHDRAWQMPLWNDYQELLKSPFADMANIGGRWGGSITAACFLARFTKKYVWAHLDIAGTAWTSGTEKGATGRPVPLLMHYLLKRAGKLK
ncbi:MAG: Cytosol aminopeptidase [Candidatus Accumulibacter regalis]|uniref:Probable cytosol aminopeptidase n=1 Tax=Accumulibacter regalis TaxID=522306 RepID=A0A011QM83_ACCRE|nr:leucyl aminopeptidase [Accumulibacter sp.]EXI90432.1 MAG: Cytosol aminopeptidase [Candidatus Accumulibacter regalis]MBN8515610.1 leucyl aminopeptidase [Accumulibacter sp.]MBO3703521.1 leucyl aminopeptidase [Accumulibacter sp.]HRE70751.1 leucyl aminopeptidase [Accumulibacter sp.]HRE84842.1 leucyl aminopeptidase [Accumulibacter sp.]